MFSQLKGRSGAPRQSPGQFKAKNTTQNKASALSPNTSLATKTTTSLDEIYIGLDGTPARSGKELKLFQNFLAAEFAQENLNFLCRVSAYSKTPSASVRDFIIDTYVRNGSPHQVNLSDDMRQQLQNSARQEEVDPHMFEVAAHHIADILHNDSYPRFLHSPYYQPMLQFGEEDELPLSPQSTKSGWRNTSTSSTIVQPPSRPRRSGSMFKFPGFLSAILPSRPTPQRRKTWPGAFRIPLIPTAKNLKEASSKSTSREGSTSSWNEKRRPSIVKKTDHTFLMYPAGRSSPRGSPQLS